jgi:hypothetical protein
VSSLEHWTGTPDNRSPITPGRLEGPALRVWIACLVRKRLEIGFAGGLLGCVPEKASWSGGVAADRRAVWLYPWFEEDSLDSSITMPRS